MRKRSELGFTLVEVLIVTAVLGVVLTSLGAAINRNLPSWRVRQAAAEVASSLRAARARAILDRADVSVPFDTDRLRYTVLRGSSVEKTYEFGHSRQVIAALPQGVRFVSPASTNLRVTLDPPGTESDAALFSSKGLLRSDALPGFVYLGNAAHNIYYRVSVNSIGITRVERWTGQAWL